jgi:protease IV
VARRRGVRLVMWLMLGAVVISMAAVVGAYALLNGEPPVPEGATLVLRIGDLNEGPDDILREVVGGPRVLTVQEIVASLRKAKTDSRIAGVLVVPNGLPDAYWAKVQEVRDAILDFRQSRKPAYAYLEYGGEHEYYLATACDRVFLMPSSPLDLVGLASYQTFLRGALDKIGAYPDLAHIGEYKTASNQLTQTTMTPAHREMAESLNRDLFDQLVHGIAEGRGKTDADVRALIDQGPFLADVARAAGLVDALAYEDQIDDLVPVPNHDLRLVEGDQYTRVRPAPQSRTAPRLGVIYVSGTIASGRSRFDPVFGGISGSDTIVQAIRQARADSSLRALVVRIDSPGGSTIASDVIWRELLITRREKPDRPTIVSMSDLAASGGYYIATSADAIVAQPGTLTGSIGIFGGKIALDGTYKKLGLNVESVGAGRNAEMNSPVRPYNESERAKLQEQLRAFYDQFLEKVATARGLSISQVDAIAQGRVWTGRQAKGVGLVDELGGLQTAVRLAKRRATIAEDAEVTLVSFPGRRGLIERLFEQFGQSGYARVAALMPDLVQGGLSPLALSRGLFRPGEVLVWLPLPLR